MNKKSNQNPERSRRQFIKATALSTAGLAFPWSKASASASKPVSTSTSEAANENELRVITYNVYGATGWPREHSTRVLDSGQMPARIAQELLLYHPDIVQIAEAPVESIIREIAATMNMSYCFFPSAGDWPGAVLTKHTILGFENVPLLSGEREEDLFTRHWGKARILLNNGEEIIIHSIHLYPGDIPENNAIRAREITHILPSLNDDLSGDRNVLILADLNHTPDMDGYGRWIEAGWIDTFDSDNEADGYTFRADERYKRIDYVLAKGPIADEIIEGRPLFEGAFRTNPDDPESFALSDHLPHLAVFKIG